MAKGERIFLIRSSDMKWKYKRVICLTWTSNCFKWTSNVFIGQCAGTLPIFLHAQDWMEQETVIPLPYKLVRDLRPLHLQHQITEWKVQRSCVYTVFAYSKNANRKKGRNWQRGGSEVTNLLKKTSEWYSKCITVSSFPQTAFAPPFH